MRHFKKLIFFIVVLLSITTAGVFYLNTIFLPLQVKSLITQKAKTLLKREVFIEHVLFHPGKGIVIKNIRIDQNNGDPVPFLTIQEISVSIPLPMPNLAGRFFIPAVTIKNPVVDLKYSPNGQWNFSDIIALKNSPPAPSEKTGGQPRLSIGSITIVDGQATITDPHLSETVSAINTTVQIDLLRNINFDLSFLIPSHSSVVHAAGHFMTASKELTAAIQAQNADIPPLLSLSKIPLWVDFRQCFLKKTDLTLKFKDGEITIDGSVIGAVDVSTTETATRVDVKTELTSDRFVFKRKGPHFTLKGNFLAAKTILTVDQKKTFTGTYYGKSISMERTGEQFDLNGGLRGENTKMTFDGQELTGDPQIDDIVFHRESAHYTVSGKAKITNAALKNEDLDLKAAAATAEFDLKRADADFDLTVSSLSADGINSVYANKAISGNVKTKNMTVNLTNEILHTAGTFKTQNLRLVIARNITLLGSPDIELDITRNSDPADGKEIFTYKGIMTLNGDQLQGIPKFDELTGLKGTISFNNDLVETQGLKATAVGSPWELSGQVKNFQEPSVSMTARSATMNLDLLKDLFAKKLNAMNTVITGSAENVVVKYDGLVFSKDSTEITASGSLKNAEITSEKLSQKVTNINGFVEYSANALNWKNLNFSYADKNYLSSGSLKNFTAPSFKSTLSGENFELTADGTTSDRIISFSSLKGQFHHFPFDLSGTINFRGEIPDLTFDGTMLDGTVSLKSGLSFDNTKASNAQIEVTGLDLEKLKNCIPAIEKKNIAGNLSLNAKLSGPFSIPNNWQGSGALSVKDGRLLEIDLLKGIWKTLFSNLLVDDYKHIAFTQATGNFKMAGGRISTQDLLFKSTSVDLSMSGWIELTGAINFDVVADVRQAPIVTSEAVKAVPTTIISQFAKNVVGFKLTGSLSQPQTKYKILPLKVLKKTSDSVFLGIQGMMEDLLQ